MKKKSNSKYKETKKNNDNFRFSNTAVDPHDRLMKQFQQAFAAHTSSSTYERTSEGITEITESKTDQQKEEEFNNQYHSFRKNEDMSMSNIEKKDEHYAAMMAIQGIM